jgi:hypothetical protein
MRVAILLAAWVTPALLAGVLGWTGIWGTGSAVADFLIPVPVAGGALHVPSFAIMAGMLAVLPRLGSATVRRVAVAAVAVAVAALVAQVDFDRLHGWLTTDYLPFGSPVRMQGNPLLLFVATDAAWLAIAALATGGAPAPATWLVLPAVVLLVAGFGLYGQRTADPDFVPRTSVPGAARGNSIELVYIAHGYDATYLRAWLEGPDITFRPWESVNDENVAVIFTGSRQLVEWNQLDGIAGPATVATACLHEEDRSVAIHPGYVDCFAGRLTVAERLATIAASGTTGLGGEVDQWYTQRRLCDGVVVPPDSTGIALHDFCRAWRDGAGGMVRRMEERYGVDSRQLAFVVAEAAAAGLVPPPGP